MSKSFQELLEIFNPKKTNDKIKTQEEKKDDKLNLKMKKMLSEKISINKNIEKKIILFSNKNNITFSNTNSKEDKQIIKPITSIKEETVLTKVKLDLNKNYGDKMMLSAANNEIKVEDNNENNIITKSKTTIVDYTQEKKEKESMTRLEIINDVFKFTEEEFKKRRYDKNNVENTGKKFFKLRYLKNKLKENQEKVEKNELKENKGQNEDSQLNLDKERILRKYNSEFILIVEKSILSFNVKNFKDSYEILKNSEIIKDVKEYGEFLLVVSGFDKYLIGEFLAKEKYPNEKKEVLINFIESINMKIIEINFLDCLRFLFSRLNLPKDANLILEIMDKFSVNYFEVNKKDPSFIQTFKSSDKIYLLISTILALNTMFTRKDIKNKNVIKKEEFIKMNIEISKEYIEKLYDELKKNPISMTDDYNEITYKKLASFVGENKNNKEEEKSGKELKNNYSDRLSNSNNKGESEENIDEINIISEKSIKNSYYSENLNDNEVEEKYNIKEIFENLKDEDKSILTTPQKLYKLKGSRKSELRDYVFSKDFSQLYYLKKPKKILYTETVKEVLNGSEHSHNNDIIKYLRANPSEEQFKNNFITFVSENYLLNLMSDNLDSLLKWYKAIKNLISIYRNINIKSDKSLQKFEIEIKDITYNIWESLLNRWNIYGIFLIIKLTERNNFSKEIQSLETKKKLSDKNIKNFLKAIESKLSKDKEIDYSEFINLYYVGLPNIVRKSLWKFLIGNPCSILANTYELIIKKIPIIDFKDIYLNNTKDKIYHSDNISNKIIKEIIMDNNIYIKEDLNKKFDKIKIMNKVYNIARCFWVLRPDIPFNKSLINIIYFLLNIFDEEADTFFNVTNLICSNILPIFMGDENEIRIYSTFFNKLLEKYLPKINTHFKKLEITPELYMIPWFEELFTKTFNINILNHIFDLFLLNGEYILFQTSLSILKSLEDELPNLTINEIFKVLQKFPGNISEIDFMYVLNSFQNINKEVSDWKSQNYLAKQKSDLFSTFFS